MLLAPPPLPGARQPVSPVGNFVGVEEVEASRDITQNVAALLVPPQLASAVTTKGLSQITTCLHLLSALPRQVAIV